MRRIIEDKDGIAAIRNTKRTSAFWMMFMLPAYRRLPLLTCEYMHYWTLVKIKDHCAVTR